MAGLAGTGDAIRFALKRDRLILPVCIAGLVGWMAIYVISYSGLYGTQAELNALYESVAGNPALVAMTGPTGGLHSLGGATAWESLPVVSIISGVFAMFSVIRHSRAEEEDGRTELLLASGSGRFAPLAAALIVTAAALMVAAAGYLVILAAWGYEVGPSVLLSLAILGFGLVITGTTAVFSQVTGKARAARGLVGVVIGVAWLLRAIGDTGDGTLSWFSPLGWAQQTRPFWENLWWPLLLPLAATGFTVSLSFWLLARRDIGSGLVQPRPGPSAASPSILHPLGFSFRLQRGTVIAWTLMLFVYGFAVGAVGNNIEDLVSSSAAFTEALGSVGGDLLDSYFASILSVIAILGAGFTISSVLRPHAEESRDRASLLLSAPLGKLRWVAGHTLIAYAASAVMIALTGLGLGIGLGVATGDFSQSGKLLAAGFAQAPAMWLTGSLALLLFGISSRLSSLAWALLAGFVLIWTLASFGNLPEWLVDLSPFSHVPAVPAVALDLTPLFVMTALSIVITAAGLALWRRRDLL
ncbi:MAG TPA: hypothetical protein PKD76_04720 [Solirubrobacterales bacterium]|nr:hypothetical protein [Solirubrobacterales bacterium]